MKIILCLILCLVLSFAGCGQEETPAETTAPATTQPTTQPTETTEAQILWPELDVGSQYDPYIASATFDIDSDGVDELCTLSYGPTSGLFTFIFSASQSCSVEYYSIFNSRHGELSFVETETGMKLRLVTSLDGEIMDYTIGVDGGNVVLTANGEIMPYYGR